MNLETITNQNNLVNQTTQSKYDLNIYLNFMFNNLYFITLV